jgi:hypothetical protein
MEKSGPDTSRRLVNATKPIEHNPLAPAQHVAGAAPGCDYAAKREAIRRDLITREEEEASVRAIALLAGARDYSAP